jgi:hypothetical protein
MLGELDGGGRGWKMDGMMKRRKAEGKLLAYAFVF